MPKKMFFKRFISFCACLRFSALFLRSRLEATHFRKRGSKNLNVIIKTINFAMMSRLL